MMRTYFLFPLVLSVLCLLSCNTEPGTAIAGNLKCEYMINPLGIDKPHPRFTWQLLDERMGAKQKYFRVVIGTDSADVAKGKGNIWISDKVNSGANLVTYTGDSLKPLTRYFWSVRIWGKAGKRSAMAPVASFETGMMGNNWKGFWITDTRDSDLKPAPCFRSEFDVRNDILSARAYIAVAGLYELYINGNKAGNAMLDPAFTRYDRRNLYAVHDVTSLLRNGKNAVGVMLGNGWYNHQSTAVWYFHEATWRARPSFCAEIHITYTDGTKEIIKSGTDWKTSVGEVIFNSIYTAEHHDARLKQTGWEYAGFDDSKWKNPIIVAAPSQNVVSQSMHPIRAVEEITPVSVKRIDGRTWVFDLGRNISGVSRLTVSGAAGTEIRLKHAERIGPDGRADQSNIDVHYRPTDNSDPFQTDIFILSGKGKETFMPKFNYKGFQYVEVISSVPLDITLGSLKGYFMHSDVPPAGNITSSDTLFNKIWKATNNSYLSNLFGYPTDCPQREKNGWTGDGHIASETGLYNFDAITLYEKWLRDHQDEQQSNGVLPAIIPTSGWGYHWANGPDWTSTIAIIPWNIYLFYGDQTLLADCYDNLKRYVDHLTEISPSGLTDWGLGDWIPIRSVSSRELTSSIYYYTDALILSKAAALLGNMEDEDKYSALATRIKDAINVNYLDTVKGIYASGLQTELSMPLHWGIVPESLRHKVADNLAKSIMNNGGKMDVGLLGTKAILNALSDNGYADLAYELASMDKFPSWGWWIANGATTLFENWPVDAKSDISMNHIMFGEIGAWMYKCPGGIFPDENNPGFKNIILKPSFVKGLDHFEAVHDGPYGRIISSWRREGNDIIYNVTVPANSSATFFTHSSEIKEGGKKITSNKYIHSTENEDGSMVLYLESGKYSFTITETQQ